jgi:hypothetical protein
VAPMQEQALEYSAVPAQAEAYAGMSEGVAVACRARRETNAGLYSRRGVSRFFSSGGTVG